jgi:hypothetical protein
VLDSLEPQVASMHLSAFDGSKLSLATLLISPKAWAESLAFFAATWSEDKLEDEPETLAESLFAHIHGIIFSTDDAERRTGLIHEALATDWGTTAFAVLFSTATEEIIELANDIYSAVRGSGQTTSDRRDSARAGDRAQRRRMQRSGVVRDFPRLAARREPIARKV